MLYNRVVNSNKEVKTVSATKEIITDAKRMIEELKKLPENRQEYINGYTQGVLDALSDKNKTA